LHSRRRRRRARHQCLSLPATSPLLERPRNHSGFRLQPHHGRRSLSGSASGGIAETQEMLDCCGEHKITSDVEVIPIQKVNEAYERLFKSDCEVPLSPSIWLL